MDSWQFSWSLSYLTDVDERWRIVRKFWGMENILCRDQKYWASNHTPLFMWVFLRLFFLGGGGINFHIGLFQMISTQVLWGGSCRGNKLSYWTIPFDINTWLYEGFTTSLPTTEEYDFQMVWHVGQLPSKFTFPLFILHVEVFRGLFPRNLKKGRGWQLPLKCTPLCALNDIFHRGCTYCKWKCSVVYFQAV